MSSSLSSGTITIHCPLVLILIALKVLVLFLEDSWTVLFTSLTYMYGTVDCALHKYDKYVSTFDPLSIYISWASNNSWNQYQHHHFPFYIISNLVVSVCNTGYYIRHYYFIPPIIKRSYTCHTVYDPVYYSIHSMLYCVCCRKLGHT